MRIPSLAEVLALFAAREWVVHPAPRVNILFLRKTPGALDAFDDMAFLWRGEEIHAYRVTTDPGRPSREHPTRQDGTAVWAPGQVVEGLHVGLHKRTYPCLVPTVPIPVLRYTSLTAKPTMGTSWSVQHHRANANRESTKVDNWSTGCVVAANPLDYSRAMGWFDSQVAGGFPRFSVALVEWDGKGRLG